MNRVITAMCLLVLACSSVVRAESTSVLLRSDISAAGAPAYMAGVFSQGWELYVCGLTPNLDRPSSVELGRPFTSPKSPILGELYGVWTADGWQVEPWFAYGRTSGKFSSRLDLGCYIPVTGGTFAVYSSGNNIMYHPTSKIGVGIVSTMWHMDGASWTVKVGPMVQLKTGLGQFELRYLPHAWSPTGAADAARIQFTFPI